MDSSIVSGCVIVVVCALPSPHRVAGKQSSSTFGNLFFFHGCHRDDGYVLASHEKAINLSLELWYGTYDNNVVVAQKLLAIHSMVVASIITIITHIVHNAQPTTVWMVW